MDAIEYVEMLATLDRQIAGLEDLLTRPELPALTAKITGSALERWRAIRAIVARQNQPKPLIAPQIKALRALIKSADGAQCDCTISQRDTGHAVGCWMPDIIDAIEMTRQNFDEEVFAK